MKLIKFTHNVNYRFTLFFDDKKHQEIDLQQLIGKHVLVDELATAHISDGKGRNGLYTKYLLKHLKTKRISIDNLLKRVSKDVKRESHKEQTPWRESSFDGDFYF